MTANFIYSLVILVLLLSCGQPESKRWNRSERKEMDSISQLVLFEENTIKQIEKDLSNQLVCLKEGSIKNVEDEVYRITIKFAWGNNFGGSPLSIKIERRGSQFVLTTSEVLFVNKDSLKQISMNISRNDYNSIANLFDTISFWQQPIYQEVDYHEMDADAYFIEGNKNKKYTMLYRKDTVEDFVFEVFSRFLQVARYDKRLIKQVDELKLRINSATGLPSLPAIQQDR